ncbi:hypothetical protein HK104_009322 [Borealophlyctis nickersoniae]|nr:hypothetical protein HK104_009322 [Borealophlyctis nickersoniae]
MFNRLLHHRSDRSDSPARASSSSQQQQQEQQQQDQPDVGEAPASSGPPTVFPTPTPAPTPTTLLTTPPADEAEAAATRAQSTDTYEAPTLQDVVAEREAVTNEIFGMLRRVGEIVGPDHEGRLLKDDLQQWTQAVDNLDAEVQARADRSRELLTSLNLEA